MSILCCFFYSPLPYKKTVRTRKSEKSVPEGVGCSFKQIASINSKPPLAMGSHPYLGDWASSHLFGKLALIPFCTCPARRWCWRQPQRSHSFHSTLISPISFAWQIYHPTCHRVHLICLGRINKPWALLLNLRPEDRNCVTIQQQFHSSQLGGPEVTHWTDRGVEDRMIWVGPPEGGWITPSHLAYSVGSARELVIVSPETSPAAPAD